MELKRAERMYSRIREELKHWMKSNPQMNKHDVVMNFWNRRCADIQMFADSHSGVCSSDHQTAPSVLKPLLSAGL